MFDAEAASFVCEFIEYLTCSNGAPFRLMDWQRDAVTEFYGQMIEAEGEETDAAGSYLRRYQYLYLEIAKKNGKSELAAALGVYHLYADGEVNGEVYVVAADRDNAGIVYSAAKWMVEHSPALMKRSRIVDSVKTIYDTVSGSKLKVLSSEAYSKHGYKPSCVIFDELHAQPTRDLWDVMTFGAGDAREMPVWIVLTTAGDDPDRKSIGWEVHEKALSILRCRQGCAREGDMDDPRWLPIIYGLGLIEDEDELKSINIYDEDLWRRCNPSIGKTVKLSTIRAEAQEAKRSEAAERLFRWLRLNQWIATHTVGWIPVTIYDKTQWNPEGCKDWREAVNLLRGKKCFGGGDLSKSTDLSVMGVIGGITYMGIETIWRGHSHWTMGVLGGLCFVLIGMLDEVQDHPPLWLQMVQGAVLVTALELITGLIVNRWLGWGVWDYSDVPFNLWGQVCPQFMVAWFFLSAAAVWMENALHRLAGWLAHRQGR